ncbi:hypothetical protein HPP92_008334 [Vanilla planifolia]|uniref:Uncharacterized protein n=1 Tax=Vanilla planifolia TaxID=51239 RepID=A0A835RC66_VANPL|nr:hypothetical protein HPP92_008334 [Vanilla planifolia]
MLVSYLNGQQLFLQEFANSGNSNEDFKEGINTDITASEFEVESEKMVKILPMNSNVTCRDRSSKCQQESCPCSNGLNLQGAANFFNSSRNLVQWNLAAGEYLDCLTLNLLFQSTFLLSTPFNLTLSKFIFKDMINERKQRTMKDLCGILSRMSLTDGTSNIVPNTFGQLKPVQLVENAKAKDLLKKSLVQLGVVDDLVTQLRSTLISPLRRSLESSSLQWIGKTLFNKCKSEMTPLGKYYPKISFLETMQISCRSIDSQSSSYYNVPVDISIAKGWLRCLQMHGMMCFYFSDGNIPDEEYLAIPRKVESNAGKVMDCMYFFYFIDNKSSDSKKHGLKTSNLIAKMKVTSSIVVKSNRMKTLETEFVLYASHELRNEPQKSFSNDCKSKGFPRKVIKTFRPSNMKKNKPTNKVASAKLDGLLDVNESSLRNDAVGELLPNLELAAIIVKEHLDDSSKNLMVGGWGLKFLEKVSNCDTSLEPLNHEYCNENIPYDKGDCGHCMNVIIPSGFHGGPVNKIGGPSSLIDRWKSGGICDCGGWDVGCPLRVLNHISISSSASTGETETDNQSVKIFVEGTKRGVHPALSIVKMTEGLYSIYSNSSLSALQSFAVAVASIHASIPDLLTKL